MKILFYCLGLVFPFIAFLLLDLPGPALIALALQTTGIGWPVAMVWAFKSIRKHYESKQKDAADALKGEQQPDSG